MADHVGQRMTGSTSPIVLSSASSTGPLPSPGASRRNSSLDPISTQPSPSTQLAHPQPASTQSASMAPATPVTPSMPVTQTASGGASSQGQHSDAKATMHSTMQPFRTQIASSTVPQLHRPPVNRFAHPSMRPQQGPHLTKQKVDFPSPSIGQAHLCSSAQYIGLTQMIEKIEPKVVRQVVRDFYEVCLLGSEYHLAFIFNTTIQKAQRATLAHAITEFGSRLVQTSKRQLLSHFTVDDLDELADDILSKASSDFLDRALARRLETIRARSLVNALAKAERLGYDVKDVVDERKDGTEHVIPYLNHTLAQHPSQHSSAQPSTQPAQPSTQPAQPSTQPAQPAQPAQTQPLSEMPASAGQQNSYAPCRCEVCSRPLSGPEALRFHKSKQICHGNLKTIDRVGRDICPHCGSNFTSSGGLPYHLKGQVCGKYTEKDASVLMPALRKFYQERVPARVSASTHEPRSSPSSAQDEIRVKSARLSTPGTHFTAVNPSTAGKTTTPPAASTAGKTPDPYAHLSLEDRKRLEAELAQTEAHYGALLRQAMQLPQREQDEETAKIKNCFNTKQSTTRKKYGVKLRERRTKAEIEAERDRLYTQSTEVKLAQLQGAPASQDGPVPVGKKARINERGDSAATAQLVVSDSGDDSPRKRVRLADMGGLGASAATAEHTDPTSAHSATNATNATATARGHSAPQPQSVNGSSEVAEAIPDAPAREAQNEMMQLDASTETENTDSDSEEADDDIPATLTTKI